MPTFGERLRDLRKTKGLSQRALADIVQINFTYLSKIENGKLDFSDFPSEKLIRKLAGILDGDVDELLLLAQKVPDEIKQRVLERPDAFRKIAKLDDKTLDRILGQITRRRSDQGPPQIPANRSHRRHHRPTDSGIRSQGGRDGRTAGPAGPNRRAGVGAGFRLGRDRRAARRADPRWPGCRQPEDPAERGPHRPVRQKPGLLRSTIGHEAGHWDLDVDRAKLSQPMLPGIDLAPCFVHRHAAKSDRLIEVLFTKAMTDDRAYKVYRDLTAGQDAPEVKSAVDRYQSCLLMPKWLMLEAAEQHDLTKLAGVVSAG